MEFCTGCKKPIWQYTTLHPGNVKINLEVQSPYQNLRTAFGSIACLINWIAENGT